MTPHTEILPPSQKWAWPQLGQFKDFVLYGGTALALRHGHRTSTDFDFFGSQPFDPLTLKQKFPLLAAAKILQASENTLTTNVPTPHGDVQISIFGNLAFGRIGTPDHIHENDLRIASDLDIAVQKLKVIQGRAHEKDYLDLDTLFQTGTSLAQALASAEILYPGFPETWAIKALTYFKDVKDLPEDVKKRLINVANNFIRTTLPIKPPPHSIDAPATKPLLS